MTVYNMVIGCDMRQKDQRCNVKSVEVFRVRTKDIDVSVSLACDEQNDDWGMTVKG